MKPRKAIQIVKRREINPALKDENGIVRVQKGMWIDRIERREVTVMAIVGTWAMVRRKGCMPYTCKTKDLEL